MSSAPSASIAARRAGAERAGTKMRQASPRIAATCATARPWFPALAATSVRVSGASRSARSTAHDAPRTLKAGSPSRSDSSLSATPASPSSSATPSSCRTGVSTQPGRRTWKAAASALGSATASGRAAALTRKPGTVGDTTVMEEAEIVTTQHGDVPRGDGWYVLNAQRARWKHSPGFGGSDLSFQGDVRFPEVGFHLGVLAPGEPASMYHREDTQEGFLVLSGRCLAIVEGREVTLEA